MAKKKQANINDKNEGILKHQYKQVDTNKKKYKQTGKQLSNLSLVKDGTGIFYKKA